MLVSLALEGLVPHLFTTRALDFRIRPDGTPSPAWQTMAEALGQPHGVWRVHQVHGARVMGLEGVTRCAGNRGGVAGEADALVSDSPGTAVAVQTADCVPILMASADGRVVAAVHAGWRGTARGIVLAAAAALVARGVDAGGLVAAIGPSIGPCCYQVGGEVRSAFHERRGAPSAAHFDDDPPGRYRLDMWEATRVQLVEAGLATSNIHVARLCTVCHRDVFFSYRAEGESTGRLAGIIAPRD